MNAEAITRASRSVLLMLLLAVSACQKSDEAAAPAGQTKNAARQQAPQDEVDPAVVEANRRMAAAVPMGSGTAPVDARFDLKDVPQPGKSFDVEVAVLPQAPTPVLHVDVEPGEGLTVESPEAAVNFEKVQAGSLERLVVKASSAAAGTRVLGIKVTLELPTGAESREFAFPVLVGAPVTAPAPPAGQPAR